MYGIQWSTIISTIIGAIVGGLISWFSTSRIIKGQEKIKVKRSFIRLIIDLITKITYNDFPKPIGIWKSIRDYCIILDEEVGLFISYHESYRKKILIAYEKYKNPKHNNGCEPFSGYYKKENLAIKNLKEILNIIKKD